MFDDYFVSAVSHILSSKKLILSGQGRLTPYRVLIWVLGISLADDQLLQRNSIFPIVSLHQKIGLFHWELNVIGHCLLAIVIHSTLTNIWVWFHCETKWYGLQFLSLCSQVKFLKAGLAWRVAVNWIRCWSIDRVTVQAWGPMACFTMRQTHQPRGPSGFLRVGMRRWKDWRRSSRRKVSAPWIKTARNLESVATCIVRFLNMEMVSISNQN